MTADFPAVLDACVLVQAPLRDTLLRLAEPPRLYIPQWSDEIIAETVRTLKTGLACPHRRRHTSSINFANISEMPGYPATNRWSSR